MNQPDNKNIISGTPYRYRGFLPETDSTDSMLQVTLSTQWIIYSVKNTHNQLQYFKPFHATGMNQMNDLPSFIRSAFDFDEALRKNYGKVTVALHTDQFTFFPSLFSSPEIALAWQSRFVSGSVGDTLVYRDRLFSETIDLVFAFPDLVKKTLDHYFTDYVLLHHLAKPLEYLASDGKGTRLYMVVHGNRLDVIVFSNRDLVFANEFLFEKSEDFIYYVMAVMFELDLDRSTVPVILFGEIVNDSSLYRLLHRYVRTIRFGELNKSLKVYDDYPLPAHFYFSLHCL